MRVSIAKLKTRLVKLERKQAARRRREKPANCNCRQSTSDYSYPDISGAKEFEAEMNLPCPAHGFRSLGRLTSIRIVDRYHPVVEDPELDKLRAIYIARLIRYRAAVEVNDDSEYGPRAANCEVGEGGRCGGQKLCRPHADTAG
jgi:hypothetical protein